MRRQYENTPFLDGESHDDFAPHLGKMVHELEILGDPEDPRKIAVRVALVAVSIESLLDISTMSIEEIIDRLRVVEGKGDDEDDSPTDCGKLVLTEEQWQAHMKEK
jgi:hypothetical protein